MNKHLSGSSNYHLKCVILSLLVAVLLLINTVTGRSIVGLHEQAHRHKPQTDVQLRPLTWQPPHAHQAQVPSISRGRRSNEESVSHFNQNAGGSVAESAVAGMLSMVLLTALPVALVGLMCCKRMGAANPKLDKKLIVDEASPFHAENNPMDVRAEYSNPGSELGRRDSCAKTDTLYRSDSLHPLGSPTCSTFGAFTVTSEIAKEPEENPKKVKQKITKCASEPNLLDESPVVIPQSFLGASPSHVSELLRDSGVRAKSASTISLVPGPSLTHPTPPPSSQPSQTLTPVYIIPPEVERVDIRPGRSPQPQRKAAAVHSRLNSAASASSLESVSSWQQNSPSNLGESSELTQGPPIETGHPPTVLRAVARVKGSGTSPSHRAAAGLRESTVSSSSSVISYFLTQESLSGLPRLSTCELPENKPPPFCKLPSPLRTRTDKPPKTDTVSDMKQRALPPTPTQLNNSTRHSPLARTSGTLPLKRHRSPLLSSEMFPDESSLDSKRSQEIPPTIVPRQDTKTSQTLPTKKHGHNLVLKSITRTDPMYHRLESFEPQGEDATPPPRPPRKLIDPTRQVDFSHLLNGGASDTGDGVRSGASDSVRSGASDSVRSGASDGVRSGASDDTDIWSQSDAEEAVCVNCGRLIRAEPFYICMVDSEDGSTRGSVSDTPEVSQAEDTPTTSDAMETTHALEGTEVRTPAEDMVSDRSVTPVSTEGTVCGSQLDSTESVTTHSEGEAPVICEPSSSPTSPMSTDAPQTECTLDISTEGQSVSQATPPGSLRSVTSLELDEEVRPKPPTGPAIAVTDNDGFSFEEELRPGSAICMDCVKKEGPIYHELEPAEIEAILSSVDPAAPPIPPRERPPRPNPVYERIASVKRKLTLKLSTRSRVITRVSVDGAYIIEASKPRRLRFARRDSSTDYEHISTDQDTPSSPHYHRASEVHQQGVVPLPAHLNPADHIRCKPHPPPLVTLKGNQNSTHDYESLPGSLNGRAVNLCGLGKRRGSHDYAFIGPAPSIESLDSLDERSVSPPFIPPGVHRATLMKIDSQGYASVIVPDHSDDFDCLQSTDRECPFHGSKGSLNSVGHLPGRVPMSDYEVPVVSLAQSEGAQASKGSPRCLARQSAISESEEMTEVLVFTESLTSTSTSADVDDGQDRSEDVTLVKENASERAHTDGTESVFVRAKSVTDRDSPISVEIDSGIENSNERFEMNSPQGTNLASSLPPPRPPRTLSLSELQIDATADPLTSPPRPRARTFHSKASPQKSNKKLNIMLNQQSSVVV